MKEFTYAELEVGLGAEFKVEITLEMMASFEALSGDVNPLHTNAEYARREGFRDRVVYGMLTAGFYSRLVGVQLPGKYCLFQEIQNSFIQPVFVGDTLIVSGKIVEKIDTFRRLKIKAEIHNQEGQKVSRATLYVGVLK